MSILGDYLRAAAKAADVADTSSAGIAKQIGDLAMKVDQNELGNDLEIANLSAAISQVSNNLTLFKGDQAQVKKVLELNLGSLTQRVAALEAWKMKLGLGIGDDVNDKVIPRTTPPANTFLNVKNSNVLAKNGGAAPATGSSLVQASTGATIKRLATGLIDYSRFTRVSVDNTYCMVFGENSTSMIVINRATGATVRTLPTIGENNEPRWNYVASYSVFFYVTGRQFRSYDVATGTDTLIRDFTGSLPGTTDMIINDVEGDSSNDSRYWAWMCMKLDGNGNIVQGIITYDKTTNTILGTMLPTDTIQGSDDLAHVPTWRMGKPNMVEIAPDGSGVMIHWDRKYSGNNGNLAGTNQDGPHLWNKDFSGTPRRLAVDATHSAWAMDAAGTWHFVSQDNRTDYMVAVPISGTYSATGVGNLRILNTATADTDLSMGFHFAKSYVKKGYVLVSTNSSTEANWCDNQIFFLPMINGGGPPVRVCHTYSQYPGDLAYRNEAPASQSFDGNGVYWSNNWNGTITRATFEVILPDTWG